MKRCIGVVLALLALVSPGLAQQKKRVAVLNFDYATVETAVQGIFGTNQDVGKGVSDLLVNQLVKSGTYIVVERNAIDKVIGEQNFSNSYRVDPATAAKIGHILGVDAIILGSVTQFGRDDQSRSIGGGGLGSIGRRYGFGGAGVKLHKAKAVVGLSARLIDVNTAQILAVADGKGESTRSGTSLIGGGGNLGGAGGGNYDMGSSNFASTILGEAVHSAVDNLAQQLGQDANQLPTVARSLSGEIADASGNPLILNIGSKAGVKVGDQLGVYRKVRDVKDPVTGRVIKTIEDKIGEVKVTEVDALSSEAQFTGSGSAKVGDTVKNEQ
ncbi:MAG: CsgG/HfaB family protein [Terriglobia bacterium]